MTVLPEHLGGSPAEPDEATNQGFRCHHTWVDRWPLFLFQSLSTGPPAKKLTPRDPRRAMQNPDYY